MIGSQEDVDMLDNMNRVAS